jgi:hypothetical protein
MGYFATIPQLPSVLMFLKPNVLYYHHKGMPWDSIWSSNFNENWTNLIHVYSSTEQLQQTKSSTYCFGTRPYLLYVLK